MSLGTYNENMNISLGSNINQKCKNSKEKNLDLESLFLLHR